MSKRDFSAWGSFFTVGLVVLLIASLINAFVGSAAGGLWIAAVGVMIFAGLLVFDTWRLVRSGQYGQDDYVLAAVSIYLDLLNMFLFILSLLGGSRAIVVDAPARLHLRSSRRRDVLRGRDDRRAVRRQAFQSICFVRRQGTPEEIPPSPFRLAKSWRRSVATSCARRRGFSALGRSSTRSTATARSISSTPTQLIGDMVAFIRRTRPTVIVTFGPEGAPTGHRDHRAVSRAATAAYFLAALRTQYPEHGLEPHQASRLYYHAWPFPVDPGLKLEGVPATATIDVRAWNEQKLTSFKAHATQQYAYDLFVRSVLRETEPFALAAGTPQPRAMTDDLFEGL